MSNPPSAEPPLHHATLAPRTRPRGAVVLLHGFGADEQDMLGLALGLPRDLLYIALRAPLELPWGGRAWYPLDLAAATAPEPTPGADAIAFRSALQAIIAWLLAMPERFAITPERTVLAGFSQGGAMTAAALLHERAPRLAGYAILSGFLAEPVVPAAPARQASVFVAHGVEDQLLPVSFGRRLRDQLDGFGMLVAYREYSMQHEVTEQESVDLEHWLGTVLPEIRS